MTRLPPLPGKARLHANGRCRPAASFPTLSLLPLVAAASFQVWPHGGAEGSRALHAALAAKTPVDVDVNSIAADSLGARRAGTLVYDIAARHVDHVALVPDRFIAEAQSLLWQRLRIASEPGGAAALGALLCGAYKPKAGERVGVLLCGANVSLKALAQTCAE
jgi:threonine dehydratase